MKSNSNPEAVVEVQIHGSTQDNLSRIRKVIRAALVTELGPSSNTSFIIREFNHAAWAPNLENIDTD